MTKTIKRLLGVTLAILAVLSLAAYAEAKADAISSDIIAGIDHSSVAVEGEATFFSSVMSDGTRIRFEGKDISVSEEGVTLRPESSLTSLDAVGKILSYEIFLKDGGSAPISEQWIDIGYGYTNTAERTSMERASDIFADALMGYSADVWNDNVSLSIAEIEPNFVFVRASGGNTAEVTVTRLTVSYDPSETFTPIEVARKTFPDHFNDFERFFGAENEVSAAVPDAVYDVVAVEAYDAVYEEPFVSEPAPMEEQEPSQPNAIYSDVIAGIDLGSVRTEGGSTFFTSVMSDGTAIRFEGQNIVISEDGLTLSPQSRVASLDAVGKIYLYRVAVKDGASAPICDQWMNIGGGYTFSPEKTSVERADELLETGIAAASAVEWNDDLPLSTEAYEPNFVCFDAMSANTADITLTALVIGYDPSEKYTAITEVKGFLPEDSYRRLGLLDEDEPLDVSEKAGISADHAQGMTGAESAMLISDVIAGIDHGSVRTEGGSTFFTSVMSNGEAVRFEGRNISVSEEGIVMQPDASVTSLDAVGKIEEYFASVKDGDETPVSEQLLNIGYGYTFSAAKTSVERADEVRTYDVTGMPSFVWNLNNGVSVANYQPNFVYFHSADFNSAPFTLTSLTIRYNPAERVTALVEAELSPAFYGEYAEGEPYRYASEGKANEEAKEYDFYLILKQEALSEADDSDSRLYFLPRAFYEVGDLKDADGRVLDKKTARVYAGSTLDVSVGDYAFTVELPMAELLEGAQTMKEARPYSTLTAEGEQHALVVPVVWADQTELVSDEAYALYQKALGRLIDERGGLIGDFSDADDQAFSLTEYFSTASYGQLEIASFLTDWYYTDKCFAWDYEYTFPEVEFADEILRWVKATYPNTDWSQFDQDGDGCVDTIVLLSVGLTQNEGYVPASFGGAVHSTGNQYGKLAGTQTDPQANCFLTVNHAFLKDGDTRTLIHEFSHSFGLNDYYDGSGYGINAVGGYDMQGNSVGDWNAYSKLAVGWMEPQVVTGLAGGESVELTIGSSALTGDVILLPAAGTEYNGPFGEYVMLDLLSPDGVNVYDAAEYGLENTVGVRISHVNAALKRTTESDEAFGGVADNGNVIGMELYSNHYQEDGFGLYNLEVIQSGGKNTFANLETMDTALSADDLFYAGDTFTAEKYDQFFYQGRMDNGLPLGYTVKILSIGRDAEGKPTASIRITAD